MPLIDREYMNQEDKFNDLVEKEIWRNDLIGMRDAKNRDVEAEQGIDLTPNKFVQQIQRYFAERKKANKEKKK